MIFVTLSFSLAPREDSMRFIYLSLAYTNNSYMFISQKYCIFKILWNFSLPGQRVYPFTTPGVLPCVEICLSWLLNFQESPRGGYRHDLQDFTIWLSDSTCPLQGEWSALSLHEADKNHPLFILNDMQSYKLTPLSTQHIGLPKSIKWNSPWNAGA